jgi:hypothetical protein
MGDQKTDNDQTVSPNMTLKTKSKSPTHGTAAEFLDNDRDDAIGDNNAYHGRVTYEDMVRNEG